VASFLDIGRGPVHGGWNFQIVEELSEAFAIFSQIDILGIVPIIGTPRGL